MIRLVLLSLAILNGVAPVLVYGGEEAPLRVGYAGTSNDGHTRMLLKAGLTTHLWAARIAPAFTLVVDENGEIQRQGIDPQHKASLRAYIKRSAELGLQLWVKTSYHKDHAKQLESLVSVNHAVAQGPWRYVHPGERGVPSPLERRYWMGQLLQEAAYVAELAKEYPNVRGFAFDLEMYAENVMWRHNSSFDDHTFQAVFDRITASGKPGLAEAARRVDPGKRYDWLKEHDLLERYFATQGELVAEMAAEFRERVRAINPELELGIVYYEPNWMHDGWARGLGTPEQPALIFSELEYHDNVGPSSRGLAQRLDDLGIYARYLPGLQPEHFTPLQFASAAAESNRLHNGFWVFTSYSLWQPDPTKLRGPYVLRGPADQYIDALAKINAGDGGGVATADPSNVLLTANQFYDGPSVERQPVVRYSRKPDAEFYGDPDQTKLFDGIEHVAPGSVAWFAKEGEQLVIDLDLHQPAALDRMRLRIGHALTDRPMVTEGRLLIETSVDGEHYYRVTSEILNPGQIRRGAIELDDVGVTARYIRLTMSTQRTPQFGVWAVSEVAVWGKELSGEQ